MKKIILLLCAGVFTLAGLYLLFFEGDMDDLGKVFHREEKEDIDKEREDFVFEPMEIEELDNLSSAKRDFSFNIFNEIADTKENAFISPYSIHTALMLAYIGADENTKREMRDLLELEGIEEDIEAQVLSLKRYLEDVSKETEVSIANAFFLREGIPFLESYKRDGENYFEAKIEKLPEEGASINKWVREETREKIEEIIDDGPIPADVIAYLINAIYFKGVWEIEFDKEETKERIFYGEREDYVDMMENKDDYLYYKGDDLDAIKLEYKDGDYLFYAFVPVENSSLDNFYETLSREKIDEIKRDMRRGEATLRMPKFTIEDKYKLKNPLTSLGMVDAFNMGDANFSKMADIDALGENIYIGEVLHKSFIEVDEEGTEAAAVTAIEMRVTSAPIDPIVIEFNRPFFFIIEEKETETILFMGHLTDPFN